MRRTTSLLLLRPGEVLLARKKRGFGTGRVVGVGGGLEPGETALDAAIREAQEEVGVTPLGAREVATLRFRFPHRPAWDLEVAVFLAERWRGEPRESDEVAPAWYPVATPPYDEMWPDARLWLPRVLAGERFSASFAYGADLRVVEHDPAGGPNA